MLVLLRWRIGVLGLGEEEAAAFGIDTALLRSLVIVSAALITAAAVVISGVVGWVGWMVPHMARLIAGPRFDGLLPVAILLGGDSWSASTRSPATQRRSKSRSACRTR